MNIFRIFYVMLAIVYLGANITSCTKTETITNTVIDSVLIRSVDTTFVMNAKSWNYYNYITSSLIDSGQTSYFTTAEGVKFMGQGFRLGGRLQSKSELGIVTKILSYKWKVNGIGQFAGFAPQLKYDAMAMDGTPAIQGVDFGIYTVNGSVTGSVSIQDNTWYYTRIIPQIGTDIYQVITSTGNYNNLGGVIISTKTMPIYTKSGYVAFRMGDNYASTAAYAIIAECKISGN